MVGSGIDLGAFQNGCLLGSHSRQRVIECVCLKPEDPPASTRLGRFTDVWMLVRVPLMKLQHEQVAAHHPLVLTAAMHALQSEHVFIPTTARRYILHSDQRLWLHLAFAVETQDHAGHEIALTA